MSKTAGIASLFLMMLLVGALWPGNLVVGVVAADKNAGGRERRDQRNFHVVGYLPDYRAADTNPDVGEYLTYLVYFSVEPDPAGDLKLERIRPENIRMLRKLKDRNQVALLLCVGGWERSAGFPQLAASPAARKRFVTAVTRFCVDNDFDGIDIDWEHPADESQLRDYATLLAAIKTAFVPHHLQLTIAVAGWQALPAGAIQAVDRIHLMAYDAAGRHSTYEFAQADVGLLVKQGVPPEKICLGIPFYGRGIEDRSRELTYAQIAGKFKPGPEVDEVDGIYFNGVKNVERKTKFALSSKLAGVMAWEIGQDTSDESSLVRAIHRVVVDSRTGP